MKIVDLLKTKRKYISCGTRENGNAGLVWSMTYYNVFNVCELGLVLFGLAPLL